MQGEIYTQMDVLIPRINKTIGINNSVQNVNEYTSLHFVFFIEVIRVQNFGNVWLVVFVHNFQISRGFFCHFLNNFYVKFFDEIVVAFAS